MSGHNMDISVFHPIYMRVSPKRWWKILTQGDARSMWEDDVEGEAQDSGRWLRVRDKWRSCKKTTRKQCLQQHTRKTRLISTLDSCEVRLFSRRSSLSCLSGGICCICIRDMQYTSMTTAVTEWAKLKEEKPGGTNLTIFFEVKQCPIASWDGICSSFHSLFCRNSFRPKTRDASKCEDEYSHRKQVKDKDFLLVNDYCSRSLENVAGKCSENAEKIQDRWTKKHHRGHREKKTWRLERGSCFLFSSFFLCRLQTFLFHVVMMMLRLPTGSDDITRYAQ